MVTKNLITKEIIMLYNLLNTGPIASFLSGFNPGAITDILIAFVFCAFGLVCCLRGFTKQILGIVVSIGSILLAYFFCDNLLAMLDENYQITQKLAEKMLSALGDKFALSLEPTLENLNEAIASMSLPEFVAEFARTALENVANNTYTTIGEFLTEIVAHHILIAGCFAAIWLVSKILLSIVKIILSRVVRLPLLRQIDRFLGLILGLVKALALVYFALYLIDVLPNSIEFIAMARHSVSQSVIGAILRENNVFALIISTIL